MAIDQVGELHELIIQLDEQTRALRQESNSVVCFVPGEDGQPTQLVVDPVRFSQIGEEMKKAITARARTVARLEAVKALLGHNHDGCLAWLSGEDCINQATRLRFEHANKMHVLMCNYRRALVPAELENVPEYVALREQPFQK